MSDGFNPDMDEFDFSRPVVCGATGIEFTMGAIRDDDGCLNFHLYLPTISGFLTRIAVIVPSELGIETDKDFFNIHGPTGLEDNDPVMRDVPGFENAISKVGTWVQSMRNLGVFHEGAKENA